MSDKETKRRMLDCYHELNALFADQERRDSLERELIALFGPEDQITTEKMEAALPDDAIRAVRVIDSEDKRKTAMLLLAASEIIGKPIEPVNIEAFLKLSELQAPASSRKGAGRKREAKPRPPRNIAAAQSALRSRQRRFGR